MIRIFMKRSSGKAAKHPSSEFLAAAVKAARRAYREAEKENARWGLPMIVSRNGRIVELPARK